MAKVQGERPPTSPLGQKPSKHFHLLPFSLSPMQYFNKIHSLSISGYLLYRSNPCRYQLRAERRSRSCGERLAECLRSSYCDERLSRCCAAIQRAVFERYSKGSAQVTSLGRPANFQTAERPSERYAEESTRSIEDWASGAMTSGHG